MASYSVKPGLQHPEPRKKSVGRGFLSPPNGCCKGSTLFSHRGEEGGGGGGVAQTN